MNEDERMFQIGVWSLGAIILLTTTLQVCYRTQNKARRHVRDEIVQTQQQIAARQANFASYVRPEILRNLVDNIPPHPEVISFHKSVSVDDLPMRNVPGDDK